MSPWYLYSINERDMVSFPQDVSMVVQIFQDDRYNDPRIAADIFNISGIPSSNKSFIIVPTDTIGPVRYKADYVTPLGNNSEFGQFDALDSLAIFRIADSLIAGSFYDDTISCKLIDGEGAFRELHMRSRFVGDSVPPLITTDSPFVHISNRMGVYLNQWNSTRNPRIDANTFRKSRKIYLQHKSKKIKQVSKYLVKTAIASNDDVESEIVNPIDNGFGSDGTFTLRAESFPSPLLQDNVVSVYLPDSIDKPVPLIVFMHGYNGGDPDYFSHTIKHIISRGMAVIFSPYPSFPSPAADKPETVLNKYKIAFTGIEEAVHRYSQFLDTTRIGIVGHSFGAGAVPSIAYRCMVETSWGKQAAFLFVTAPWYMYGITDSHLTMLPAHLKMVTIVFDDDNINDHQMAVDLFNRIHINASEKDYIVFYSDTSDSLSVTANHFTPYSVQNINGVQDNFDYFGIFKLFDALAAYSFSGDLEGKKVALGNGSTEQCYMGEWPDGSPVRKLSVSDKPKALKTQLSYLFAWDNPLNPWRLKKPSLRSRLK
jgi:hypothetical protein